MPTKVLLTGFPGFIGRRVVRSLDQQGLGVLAVVHPSQMPLAQSVRIRDSLSDRVLLLEGDLLLSDLGIGDRALIQEAEVLIHIAAVYDLSVAPEVGWAVNVEGSRHVCQLAETMTRLKTLVYVSSSFISGQSKGVYFPWDVDKNQKFRNAYEESKFHAEMVVRQFTSLPTVIVRPAIVVGDSITGQTDKFDGPYNLMKFFRFWRKTGLPVFNLGSKRFPFVTVPVNRVVDTIVAQVLSNPGTPWPRCVPVVDPYPPSSYEYFSTVARMMGVTPVVEVPEFVRCLFLKFLRTRLGGRLFGILPETADYFLQSCFLEPNIDDQYGEKFDEYYQKIVAYFESKSI